ncbi:hypothetical protein FNV62_43675 [Streptomyces sp. RLB3-17]|uniref:hypothetical protein n=1 Tax=unclassified Streptomyces TaxID=2593676 RepID=UPI001161DF5D|nr:MULTISPECIES: hypothetical protein [unclassified Streptomyces]QDO02206.1 hypothetical protein FNV58_45270 [Streptomyces sp. RLB1-9]QDO23941.1 hypothetical protein FNV65_43855 [Streptomyces sp. S1A1-8]QDO34065.1 hypothetical protein FNV63_43880 [Streptomyces sp. S1A1-3]QDO44071.1 hypothetical protein FNV62_43675 [Streptomyces sp. RLB3-17]
MSRTPLAIPPEVLEVLALPALAGLAEAKAAGRDCVWGGERLTIETVVDLGEQLAPNADSHSLVGERWFPRACPKCVVDRAQRAMFAHCSTCKDCVAEAGRCDVGRGLYRLMREHR